MSGVLALDIGVRPVVDRRRAIPEIAQAASTRTSDHRRRAAHADAVRLAVQLRAAVGAARRKSLLFCGVLPGQTVHRLVVELSRALVELEYVPVLVVDLEPDPSVQSHADRGLAETDPISWLRPDPEGRHAAAITRLQRRRAADRQGYLSSGAFADDLARWCEPASAVLCCARASPDSISTLTVATACDGVVLVVPIGAPTALVTSACDTLRQAGATLLGCVLDRA